MNKKEIDFYNLIDCKFPYNDKKAETLIDDAITLSPWCVGIVLHEIARVPNNVKVEKVRLYELLEYLDTKFMHELKTDILRICKIMIEGNYIQFQEAIEFLDKMKEYPEVSSFINIVYFSFIDDKVTNDEAIELENKFEDQIKKLEKYWKNNIN